MNLLQALILSVVEGFTEFLPVSSTGHLLLAGKLLHIDPSAVVKSFYISIQCAAIASVGVLYWRKFFEWNTLTRLIVAFIPTAIVGVTLYPFIKEVLLESVAVVAWALIAGGVVMIVFEKYQKPLMITDGVSASNISYPQAFGIGLMQSLAVIPGVSRAGATIIGGMAVGVDRKRIVEFSFLLAVPTMIAATALDAIKTIQTFQFADLPVFLIGFTGAFLTALASITWLLAYIRTHSFSAFGYYRIVIGVLFLLFVL